MIPTPTSDMVPELPAPAVSADQGPDHHRRQKQRHLDPLIHAGIVTHVVSVQEALDPLFAVAQMRDLPEVQFVAAFEDGLIALGCADGLPDVLKDIASPAQPINAQVSQDTGQTGIPEGLERIEKTSRRLEYLLDAMKPDTGTPTEGAMAALTERLSALEATLKAQAETQDIRPLKQQITGLHRRFDGLADVARSVNTLMDKVDGGLRPPTLDTRSIEVKLDEIAAAIPASLDPAHIINPLTSEDGPIASLSQGLSQIQGRLDDLSVPDVKDEYGPQTLATLDAINTRLGLQGEDQQSLRAEVSHLAQTLEALAERPAQVIDLTEQKQGFDQFAAVLAMIVKRIEAAATEIKSTQVSPERSAKMDQVAADVARLAEAADVGPPASVDLHPVLDALTALRDTVMELPKDLSELRTDLSALANQPKPVLDLTEQRRSFAAFSTTLSAVVQPLESAITQFADGSADAGTEALNAEVLSRITALSDGLDRIGATKPDLSPLMEKLDAIAAEKETVAGGLDAVIGKIDGLAQRPDPVLDLTAQRADFARFGTALGQMIKRIEATLDGLAASSGDDELNTMLAQISDQIGALPDKDTICAALRTEVSQLEKWVETAKAASDHQLGILENLREGLSGLQERPDPAFDIMAQTKAVTQMSDVLTGAKDQIAGIAAMLEDRADQPQTQAQEIIAVMQALPQVLESSIRQATDLRPIEAAVADLREGLCALPEQIGLARLDEAVSGLLARPDPVLDLTAQRQSFARFGTALGVVIDRLDTIARDLSTSMQDQSALVPLSEALARMETRISSLSEEQADKLNIMGTDIGALSERIQALEPLLMQAKGTDTAAVKTDAPPISLEDLRMQFAELIAAQIKENAASFTHGADQQQTS